MRCLNLGILAHVDAGKTSLTERLLYEAGVIDAVGSVDAGTTQTDTLALERTRGITIRAAVVSFAIGETTVNLIDTPGHPDFIAEVERVLALLDGAVLVISAVEGVQAQTRVLYGALQRLGVPTLIFVNKIDRAGAQDAALLARIAERLSPASWRWARSRDLGLRRAAVRAFGPDDPAFVARPRRAAGRRGRCAAGGVRGRPHAALRGPARCAGRPDRGLPGPPGVLRLGHHRRWHRGPAGRDRRAVARAGAGRRRASERGGLQGRARRRRRADRLRAAVWDGRVDARERLAVHGEERRVTRIELFDDGEAKPVDTLPAGRIGKLWGLGDIRIGDPLGAPRHGLARQFAAPTLETVVRPVRGSDKGRLFAALAQLAEQDPLIALRQDDLRGEIAVSLYGEVQKEVIRDTLAADFRVEADFAETTPICIERLVGEGAALWEPPYPFIARVGLRVEPRAPGAGVEFRLEVDVGSLPAAFFKAVEDAVRETLHQGLQGWEIPDAFVAMTHVIRYRHWATSNPAEHRRLTPLALMQAVKRAGTVVCEPIDRFSLSAPEAALAALLPELARLEAECSGRRARGGRR